MCSISGSAFRRRKSDHVTPLLHDLHWLPVNERIEYKMCVLCFKCLNGLAPEYLNTLRTYKPSRDLRSAKDKTMCIEPSYAYKKYGYRSFCHYGPMLWNKLPREIRESCSLDIFKKRLKTHLFAKAFNWYFMSSYIYCHWIVPIFLCIYSNIYWNSLMLLQLHLLKFSNAVTVKFIVIEWCQFSYVVHTMFFANLCKCIFY